MTFTISRTRADIQRSLSVGHKVYEGRSIRHEAKSIKVCNKTATVCNVQRITFLELISTIERNTHPRDNFVL